MYVCMYMLTAIFLTHDIMPGIMKIDVLIGQCHRSMTYIFVLVETSVGLPVIMRNSLILYPLRLLIKCHLLRVVITSVTQSYMSIPPSVNLSSFVYLYDTCTIVCQRYNAFKALQM